MIKVVAANAAMRCSTCQQGAAAVDVILGNQAIESTFHLCNVCAHTLLENLQRRKGALIHADTV